MQWVQGRHGAEEQCFTKRHRRCSFLNTRFGCTSNRYRVSVSPYLWRVPNGLRAVLEVHDEAAMSAFPLRSKARTVEPTRDESSAQSVRRPNPLRTHSPRA